MSEKLLPELVLASASPYRRALLERLRLPFLVDAANIDEAPLEGETAAQTAGRLARQKAQSVALRHPQAIVIGSDQVASWQGQQIGKPGTHERALAQLVQFQGETVRFFSALCVLHGPRAAVLEKTVPVDVLFRRLPRELLDSYLRVETPYDCAGSAKAEGLGIALLERIDSTDPTALVGLPLIALVSMLIALDYPVLGPSIAPPQP